MEGLTDGDVQTNRPLTPPENFPWPKSDLDSFSMFPWPPPRTTMSALACCVVKIGFLITLLHGKFQVTSSLRIGIKSYPPLIVTDQHRAHCKLWINIYQMNSCRLIMEKRERGREERRKERKIIWRKSCTGKWKWTDRIWQAGWQTIRDINK